MGDELAHYMFQGQTPAYPYPDPYYRSIFAPYESHPYPPQPYPTQPMAHFQLMGIQQAGVPLPSDAVEKHVFVNAKQYHGILRRRQSHAKDESQSNMLKPRKVTPSLEKSSVLGSNYSVQVSRIKPYLHESRHLHALKRARGCGVISSTQRRVMMMKTTERACFKPKITSKLYALHQKKHHHPPSND